jgi:tRNA(Arg) A34 adenosine deaminase TadA
MEDNGFPFQVERQIQRLQTVSLRQIELEVAQKRIAWVKDQPPVPAGSPPISPRRAFEMLFFEYMGLSEADLPIGWETEHEVVWLSRNPCPTLEACQALRLDTREVCRAAYEKSTQAFLSQLDPQLRFLRSYQEIRPHAGHCREQIVRIDFTALMEQAVQEAITSRLEGNKGYGAVVALGRKVIARAHDTAATERDPSLHAEVNAIRQAAHRLGDPNLSGAVLFSTCEPCPMCSSLAVWANLTTIVYGASIEETARLGKARIQVGADEIAQRSPAMLEVIGGVLHDRCLALYA